MSREASRFTLALLFIAGVSSGIFALKLFEAGNIHLNAAAADNGKKAATEQAETFRAAARSINPSVVNITTAVRGRAVNNWEDLFAPFFNPPKEHQGLQPRGVGSGFIIDAEKGYILTNNHVVAGGDTWIVRTADKRELEAKLVGTDPQTDVAVLKINADKLVAARLGDSDSAEVGDWVLAVGNPFGLLEQTVTAGIISAKGRRLGIGNYEDYMQTDAAINVGNSGGPLVNLDGEVIAINSAIVSRSGGFQGIGFAVPINQAREVATKIIKHGRVVRGWIGVQVKDAPNRGASVEAVLNTGPAFEAGLRPGDVITNVDDHEVSNSVTLRDLIANTEPGKKVKVNITHDGAQREVEVRIGRQPDNWGLGARENGDASLAAAPIGYHV